MTDADSILTLGTSMVDGSPVELGPSMGPMIIYGDIGSGKTVAARSIFHQLATNNQIDKKPVIAIDGSQQGYADIAHEYGGSSLTASSEQDSTGFDPDGNPTDLSERHSIMTIDASVLSTAVLTRDTDPAGYDNVRGILSECLLREPATHIVVDPIDHLVADQGCMDLICEAMRTAYSRDIVIVCVVFDPARLLEHLDQDMKHLLTSLGSTLLLGRNSPWLLCKNGIFDLIPPVMLDLASCSSPGEGVLLTSGGGLTNLSISTEKNLPRLMPQTGPA